MTSKKKILVAEDDDVLRNILVEGLTQAGFEPIGAPDGEAALAEIRKKTPDLLLLDIIMPKKNGMEVLEELRKNPETLTLPVIIISNSGQPVEIERAKKLGVLEFLIKTTFDSNDVLEKVKGVFEQKAQSPASPSNHQLSSNTMKILVIEDDKFLRELLVSKLAAEGYAITTAIDGKEALASLEAEVPDLILLDLILPDLSGFEILEKIRAKEGWKTVPIIVLSNLDQKEDIDKAHTLGANDFMIKANFSLNEIIARIKKIKG